MSSVDTQSSAAAGRHPLNLTVTGGPEGGQLAAVLQSLSGHDACIERLSQARVGSRHVVFLQTTMAPAAADAWIRDIEQQGMAVSREADSVHSGRAFVLTVIFDKCAALSPAGLFRALHAESVTVDAVRQLSAQAEDGRGLCLEVRCHAATHACHKALRQRLLARFAEPAEADIAIQSESALRRSKRLLVMDMDSTLIQCEVIDELARHHGVFEAVQKITQEAMEGGLPFEESLRRRVSMLKGLPVTVLQRLAGTLPLTPGAETLVHVLRVLGYRIGVLSGGFDFAALRLKRDLGLDFAFANALEVVHEPGQGDVLSGAVRPPVVTPERKADLLETVAQQHGIHAWQTVAVGDGANDLRMLERAGLGIAFHAKPKVRAEADTSLSRGGLDHILYLLGLDDHDIAGLLATSRESQPPS